MSVTAMATMEAALLEAALAKQANRAGTHLERSYGRLGDKVGGSKLLKFMTHPGSTCYETTREYFI